MSSKKAPWVASGIKNLQMRKYKNRASYRFRRRINGKLHTYAFCWPTHEDAILLAAHFQNTHPDLNEDRQERAFPPFGRHLIHSSLWSSFE